MKTLYYFIILSITPAIWGCQKYLDKKPGLELSIPKTLNDYQKLLDNDAITNGSTPAALGDMSCDNYLLTTTDYNNCLNIERNCHIWASDIFEGGPSNDWNYSYLTIYYANVVLEGLNDFTINNASEQQTKNILTGQALFIRAFAHYLLQEMFGNIYIPNTDNNKLSIPLRLTADLSARSQRATVKQVFDQVIADLKQASELVPEITIPVSRPSRAAIYGLLSRVYLTMQDYPNARLYANMTLHINSTIYDYNNLNTSLNRPFPTAPNDFAEMLYPATAVNYPVITVRNYLIIDPDLYTSYAATDIRKKAYFRQNVNTGNYYFKGQYRGLVSLCTGPCTDEILLNRAECNVRLGDVPAAMQDMTDLLKKRYEPNGYTTYVPVNNDDALKYVLKERRKELLFRGLRWIDLRRLNQSALTEKTLTRTINSQTYTLTPNSPKYVFPIPNDEILQSGIEQNIR